MTSRNRGGIVVLSMKSPAELADAVKQLAEELGQTVSLTLNRLVEQALEEGGAERLAKDLADVGYQNGLRRGLHAARTKIQAAMKEEWK